MAAIQGLPYDAKPVALSSHEIAYREILRLQSRSSIPATNAVESRNFISGAGTAGNRVSSKMNIRGGKV